MPTLTCPCGHAISLTVIPNRAGFKLIQEPKLDLLVDALLETARTAPANELERRILDRLRDRAFAIFQVYECGRCQRLAVFRRASDSVPIAWYAREPAMSDEQADTRTLSAIAEGT